MNVTPADVTPADIALRQADITESLAVKDIIIARLALRKAEEQLAVAQLRKEYIRRLIANKL